MKFLKNEKGFTLIELLLVVAIIGVLATIVLSSLNKARAKARDATRLADIRTIQTALEIYNIDNGTYPSTGWQGSHTANWNTLGSTLGITLPVDPLNTSITNSDNAAHQGNYVYSYYSQNDGWFCSGTNYILLFSLEGKNGNGPNDGITVCGNQTYEYGSVFVVGVGRDHNFNTPDLSGTLK